MTAVATCLWFDSQAEEAANFYVSLVPNSRIVSVSRYPIDTPGGKAGDVMVVEFTLGGHHCVALNGGPMFQFNPAMSLSVLCATQEEIDRLWDALTEGGAPGHCGWLTDRYGVSWQVIPEVMPAMVRDPDTARAGRVAAAMMGMQKLDIAALTAAYNGELATA